MSTRLILNCSCMNVLKVFLLLYAWSSLLFFTSVECDRQNSRARTTTTTLPSRPTIDLNKPGIVKQIFGGTESSWVPGISAAVIVIIVFLISIFACCIHCPFCIVYRRNENQRVV